MELKCFISGQICNQKTSRITECLERPQNPLAVHGLAPIHLTLLNKQALPEQQAFLQQLI